MKTKTSKIANIKVGLTVMLGVIVFFIFIFLVGTGGNYFADTYRLKMYVDNVDGLTEGALVSLGGLKIGSIDNIRYVNVNGYSKIEIQLEIMQKYKRQITNKSFSYIKTIGLLGDKFVDISIGQPGQLSLNDGQFLPVKTFVGFEYLTENIQPAVDNFTVVMSNLRNITDSIAVGNGTIGRLINDKHTSNKLISAVNNLNNFTNALINKQGTLGNLLYDRSLYDKLSRITENIQNLSDSLLSGKGTAGKLLTDASLYNNINSVTDKLNLILSKADSDSTVMGGLLNDKNLYAEVNLLLQNLNALIADLKEHPDKYVQFSVF